MRLEAKRREERPGTQVEVRPAKRAKPGDKVVRIIRRIASKTRKRRRGWLGHLR